MPPLRADARVLRFYSDVPRRRSQKSSGLLVEGLEIHTSSFVFPLKFVLTSFVPLCFLLHGRSRRSSGFNGTSNHGSVVAVINGSLAQLSWTAGLFDPIARSAVSIVRSYDCVFVFCVRSYMRSSTLTL